MKKVVQIKLENYRGFHGQMKNPIVLEGGKNLLLFGENGSGKTSIYLAIKDFVDSAKKSFDITELEKNIFASGDILVDVVVKDFSSGTATRLKIGHDGVATTYHDTKGESYLLSATFVNTFLSYKDVLKIYYSNDSRSIDLFPIFLQILGNHSVVGFLITSIKSLYDDILSLSKMAKNVKEIKDGSLKDMINKFNVNFKRIIEDLILNGSLQEFLGEKYFDTDVEFKYTYGDAVYDSSQSIENRLTHPQLFLDLVFNGKNLRSNRKEFFNFLNEARLSALSLSIFLSAIKANPPNNEFNLIYLDDVFIGLDMSNRLPLLKILNDHFSDYQIFISTYDRHWFEIARTELANSEKWVEYCIYDTKKPTISQNQYVVHHQSNLQKALFHLTNALYPDYGASANYLRKALEEILLKNLPVEALRTGKETISLRDDIIKEIRKYTLKDLVDRAKIFMQTCYFDTFILEGLINKISYIFNPLSHFTRDSSFHKNELFNIHSSILNLKEQLEGKSIKYKRVAVKGESIVISESTTCNKEYQATLVLGSDLYVIKKGPSYYYSQTRVKSGIAEFNSKSLGQIHSYVVNCQSLEVMYSRIIAHLLEKLPKQGYALIFRKDVFNIDHITVKDTKGKYHRLKDR